VITLGDIFRQYGPAYRQHYGRRLSASQRSAMAAIEHCRTEALGGHVYTCPRCATVRYSYHSCRNRHCPTCQHGQAQTWLAKQQALLLPVPYFLVTFTLPAQLRSLARQHPRQIYTLLFRSSAAALQQLAADPRFLGGQIGMVGVLQTWTRDLRYHPHIHYLVPAGACSSTNGRWLPAKGRVLVHVKPLAKLFRGKVRAALQQLGWARTVSPETWRTAWVVDCRPVGSGAAALTYLAPYIFRGALSNPRIVAVANEQVTFRYRAGDSKKTRCCTLPATAFIGRFLQHVLPRGFVKVRYFGLFRHGNRQVLAQIRAALGGLASPQRASTTPEVSAADVLPVPAVTRCPACGAPMELTQIVQPMSRSPPLALSTP
jgi:hypothetical protein